MTLKELKQKLDKAIEKHGENTPFSLNVKRQDSKLKTLYSPADVQIVEEDEGTNCSYLELVFETF